MTWSYNPSLVADLDRVRMLIGDTNADDQQLTDEEISFLVTSEGNVYAASALACRVLSAKYARYADKWVGDLKILASQKARAYERLADAYDSQANASASFSGIPSAGGIYVSEKEDQESDSSLVTPYFRRGNMDNTGN